MPNQIYQILPVFEERLWGGQRLRERFGYQSDLKNIAEVYNVIAIPGHLDCTVAARCRHSGFDFPRLCGYTLYMGAALGKICVRW